jgi:hypothetical protein
MNVSRRPLLVGAASLMLWPRNVFAAPTAQIEALLSLLPDRNAAARLGARWVQQEHKEAGEIVTNLQRRLGASSATDATDATDATALRRSLANAIGDDFRGGAVVKVEGWQIARTQVELCALAYFASTGSL